MTHVLIPREPNAVLLRPFTGCPADELPLAWAAMIRAAEVQNARAGAAPAAVPALPQPVGEWRIDTSAGREILVYKNCCVIEDADARYVLSLIAAASQPADVAGPALSLLERQAIEALCAVAVASFHAADDSSDNGNLIEVQRADFEALDAALDLLDELPDDQPGYTMTPGAKAKWSLRRLLDAAPALEAPAAHGAPEYIEGGRESVEDALAIVESFGTGIEGLNDEFARQILLAAEVRRLRYLYEQAVNGRSVFRDAYRKVREVILPPLGCPACGITHDAKECPQEPALAAAPQTPAQGVPAAPDGWKLMPVEPTKEMVAAACRDHGYPGGSRSAYVLGYRSMLAAAPQAPAQEAPAAPESAPWCPDVCPITGRPFFMWIEHWQTGKLVPTYGGPYDSYTIPVKDSEGSFECERYDHDEGGWLTEGAGWHCLGVKLVNDQSFVVDPSNPRYNEIEAFAAAAPQAPAAPSADERAAYVEFLAGKFPRTYSKEDAEHWWDNDHVSALAWQAARADAMRRLWRGALASLPAAPAAPSALATQVIENLLQLARLVNTAVEDWGETKEDDTLHVIFHKEQADKLEEILDFLDSLPDAPPEEGVNLSGPSRAARVLRAQAAPAAPAVDATSDTALLDAMQRHRIALVPECEGPWDAEIFNDEAEAHPIASGNTPREALRAALAAQAKEGGAS